jgi:hypothetical protein
MPLARNVVKELAIDHGACIRPVQLRRTDLTTGEKEPVLVPCGHTLASVCPSCAERAKNLRAAQCREGWHLGQEPVIEPDDPTDEQLWWIEKRADAQVMHDTAETRGDDTADLDALLADLDEEITGAGMRGNVLPARPQRRHRSTRRRQDAPPLPRRTVDPRTVGKTYTAPDGKTFRPSLFVTLTCPSYGKVTSQGTPVDPGTYDYTRAARDALHFAALFDRFIQNLRRLAGYDVQYFAAIEPQRRLAPHVHIAIRGTVSRKELREVIAATYHQVWWPSTQQVRFDGAHLPVWDDDGKTYVDPETGERLPTWDEALDAIGEEDEPLHVARFGDRFDAQGVLAGSRDASRCIGYITMSPTATPPPPTPRSATPTGSPTRSAGNPARRPAPTGCATASSPRTPNPACGRARARARHTAANTSATPAAACWSRVSGPARPSPTTAPTARTGSWRRSVFRQPTRPGTPGNPSHPATATTCPARNGSCTSSPTASAGNRHSTRREDEPQANHPAIFRQPRRLPNEFVKPDA